MGYLGDLDQQTLDALTELDAVEEDLSIARAPTLPRPDGFSKRSQQARNQATYLIKLEGPLNNTQAIASVAGLTSLPTIVPGEGNDGTSHFCRLEYCSISKLETWIANDFPGFCLTKIRISIAPRNSPLPVLGVDPTLPQHRPSSTTSIVPPVVYPVWYFFYCTLADPGLLARLFGPPRHIAPPTLIPATIRDGVTMVWANKYKALVDRPGGMVCGWACQILSKDQEEVLRTYEGENYEVVSTLITLKSKTEDGESVRGCTFRFISTHDQLSMEN